MARRADREYLLGHAYADDRGLTDRASLYEHQDPRIDLVAEVLGLAGPVAGRTVADVGCGNGRYVDALATAGADVVAIDLSAGMLAAVAPSRSRRVVADAQLLPLARRSVDVVLLLHMLYHVPDPAVALAEARRVLRAGGRVVVATNGRRHLAEMDELWVPILHDLGVEGALEDVGLVNSRFDGDDARSLVESTFTSVEVQVLASQVVVTDPAPVVRHAASTTGAVVAREQAKDAVSRFERAVTDVIDRDGELRITTEVVVVRGTGPDGPGD
jgi:ubiquinone/menaquinone biosynthesis C-methylase UbiE